MFDCLGFSTKVVPFEIKAEMIHNPIQFPLHCTICNREIISIVVSCSVCKSNIGHSKCVSEYVNKYKMCRICYTPIKV